MIALSVLFAAGCARQVLTFSPDELELGEVDFTGEMPEQGYASESVTLTNEGTTTVTLSLPEYDQDFLCLDGFGTQEFPVALGELDPGAAYTFVVGVCAYPPGDAESEVHVDLEVDADDGPATLPISYTPFRSGE